jgi:NADPH-dependent 2,4-dienoyl-CoA reductase/sulfur reductase-like enzyme/rhodanese-related sulfurtransferase
VRDLEQNRESTAPYDHLVLATGAAPIRPPLPGIDTPGIFTLRDIGDMDRIISWMGGRQVRDAIVVGGGFIGLEVAEQLHRKGLGVTVIEADRQLLLPLDREMAVPLREELEDHGVSVRLSDPVGGFSPDKEGRILVQTKSGHELIADLVVLSIGVRPDTVLAHGAGLTLGERGAVVVNDYLQTSDPRIWALGDCVQFPHRVSGVSGMVPLAGPANRAGRLVADNIIGGPKTAYVGPLGTAIIRVFSKTAACTGLNEKTLVALGRPYQVIYLHPKSHAGYYPGADAMAMKVIYESDSGAILGAQAVGGEGVDKRIDVLATAIAGGLTVEDLISVDLCYAPPFGSAKDPVNMAGMVASNARGGLVRSVTWQEVAALTEPYLVVDVREVAERRRGAIPDSIHIPLGELRERLVELPRDRLLVVSCQTGQRSYNACRVLIQTGFQAVNLSGAYETWRVLAR